MPFINVAPLLLDSYIAGEQFTVYRRTEAVNSYGEAITGVQVLNGVGQIAPTSPNNIIRSPGFTSQEKSITVITTFPLTGAGQDASNNSYQPDLVLWKNNLYIANKVEDYTKYGAGFVSAICDVYDWDVNITAIAPTVENFLITSDGQFVITPSGEMVVTPNVLAYLTGNVGIFLGVARNLKIGKI